MKLARREHEVFAVLFLDQRHRMIELAEIFRGTINGTAIYSRQIIKRGLAPQLCRRDSGP